MVRKDAERMKNMLFDLAKEYIVSLTQPDIYGTSSSYSIEVRFYDFLGHMPP